MVGVASTPAPTHAVYFFAEKTLRRQLRGDPRFLDLAVLDDHFHFWSDGAKWTSSFPDVEGRSVAYISVLIDRLEHEW